MLGTPHLEASGLWTLRSHGCVSWGFSVCFPCCSGSCPAEYLLSPGLVAGVAVVPDVVVVAASLSSSLGEPASCVWSGPGFILSDVVALTDGTLWQVYDRGRLVVEFDVIRMRRGIAAGILTGAEVFPPLVAVPPYHLNDRSLDVGAGPPTIVPFVFL